jgi:hypothetical protein
VLVARLPSLGEIRHDVLSIAHKHHHLKRAEQNTIAF